jgi:Photosynthesis system II assembly factor YCF48
MAPDERDRRFDKALARHLRSAAPAGEAAGWPAVPASQRGSCPDAEVLAAYHERSLLPEELNSWKEHLVGCANCQRILAQLEATDEISFLAAEREEVLRKSSEPVVAPRNVEAFPAAPAPGQSQGAAGAAPPKKSRRALLLRGARWQWLAPAGAIAAGLLVWIALHENQPLPLPSLKQVQVATNQAPPPPTPSVSTAVPEISPSAKAALQKRPSAADEFASRNTPGASGAVKPDGKQEYLAQVSPSKSMADKESRLGKDRERSPSDDLLRAQEPLDRDAKTVTNARQENAEVQFQAQAANVQSQNQLNTNSPKVPGPAPLGQMEAKRRKAASAAPAAPPSPPAAVGGVAASYNSSASLEVAQAISNPHLISPPGSSVIWRAGRSGLIELSKDGGASWSRQSSGVLADLLTGSAPSDKICWIVGRVGAILLTTDGGAHWTLIPSPLSEDLGGIRATDERHATIWNARNAKYFETSDGGLTWKPLPNP